MKTARASIVLAVLGLLLSPPGTPLLARQSGATISTAEFLSRLDRRLADSAFARSLAGVSVVRAADGSAVAGRNAGVLLHPGSNMKLFTTGAALALLPPGFEFRTTLWCDADLDDGDLDGNLYLRGGGDPLLDSADVDSLAGLAAASGIRRVRGDLVADLSLFDTLGWGRGWMWDDEPDPDEGFLTPLSFGGSSAGVVVSPGPKAGDTLAWSVRPCPSYFRVENSALTVPPDSADSLVVTRVRGEDRIVLSGTMAAGTAPDTTVVSVRHPSRHFLHFLRERLLARGIRVEGASREGAVAGAIRLGMISHGLVEVVDRVNKVSDNLAAEALLKVIAARATGAPGSTAGGLAEIGGYLSAAGIPPESVILADGSGVSWYGAVSASDVVALLLDQYRRGSTFAAFYGSLPRAGIDGTLASRMAGSAARGRVAAKTGTLTGVSALSGYVTTLSHDVLAFSILLNHFPGKARELRALQDAILGDLVLLDPSR